jgi:hypothetical protein
LLAVAVVVVLTMLQLVQVALVLVDFVQQLLTLVVEVP